MAKSFTNRWTKKEEALGFQEIASAMVRFGSDVLPEAAAPCLSFSKAARPAHIYEVFGSRSNWSDEDRSRLAPFLVIGSDGAGNPICVEEDTGSVILLDHEDNFRTRQFVNSSVRQLGECLLAYMGEKDAIRFKAALTSIDAEALRDGSFWAYELAGIGHDS